MSATTAAHYRRLWRRPRYASFVFTVSLSRVSTAMFSTVGVLLVLSRTGSAPLAGVTAAAAVIPAAVSGPVLGAWLDVAARRRLLVVFDQLLGAAALAAILALAGHAPDWTVPVAAGLYSITRPFSTGSFVAALNQLVGPELLDAASNVEATSGNLAFVVGPALGGILAGLIGAASAVDLQIALTLITAALVAANPAFDAGSEQAAERLLAAVREGLVALRRAPVLRATVISGSLAGFGWGLMLVGFPLYASRLLGAPAHASGYLWAAIAGGSILGTFLIPGRPSLRRSAISYGVLGLSALLWPLAGGLVAGFLLVLLTGVLEGPAYSGMIALRQRHAPPRARAQVMVTTLSVGQLLLAAGAALGGLIDDPLTLIYLLVAVNLLAAAAAAWADPVSRRRAPTRSPQQ